MANEPDGSPGKICTHKGCNQTKGLSKTKAGNWYCGAHHPKKRAKHKAGSAKGGKQTGKNKREARDAELLTLDIKPNKASILQALVQQANYLAKDLGPRELRRHRMVVELLDRIHEHATDEGDDARKEQKVAEIMESELPNEIKLAKLVDIVGAQKATELVKVEVIRDPYEAGSIDGIALLKEAGKEGVPSISTPESFSVPESSDGDVPDVDLDAPAIEDLQPAAPIEGTAQPAVALTTTVSAPASPPAAPAPAAPALPPERVVDRTSVCTHQASELMGIYKAKVRGNFMPLEKVGKLFLAALMEGVPHEALRQRVMFPRSDTDQAHMMIADVKSKIAKAATA